MEAADFCGLTPRDLAFQRVHTTCPADIAKQLQLVFRLDEIPEELEFTTAHRIVMGLSELELGEYLADHPQEVNKTDLLGRTALWWAVRRDDEVNSLILLDHGAEPSIANAAGRSPLHNAAAQGNLSLVDALLSHGADVHQKSFEGKTALQVVGVYGVKEDVLITKRLLDAGSDIDGKDGYCRTPISLCCFDINLNIARFLLEHGADTRIPDVKGWLPWHWAIYDGAAKIVSLYLGHNCDLSEVMDGGTNVLHFMASHCAAEEVVDTLLMKMNSSKFDPAAKDVSDKTAAEILEERNSADVPTFPLEASLYRKLRRLVALARATTDTAATPSSSPESEMDREVTARG